MVPQQIVTLAAYTRTATTNRAPDENTNPASRVPTAQEPRENANPESWIIPQCSALHQGKGWEDDPTDPTHLHDHWAWSR